MALLLSYANESTGLDLPAAYARVAMYSGDKTNSRYRVELYVNKDARTNGRDALNILSFTAPTTDLTGDILPAVYAHLKSQPGFENAVDC